MEAFSEAQTRGKISKSMKNITWNIIYCAFSNSESNDTICKLIWTFGEKLYRLMNTNLKIPLFCIQYRFLQYQMIHEFFISTEFFILERYHLKVHWRYHLSLKSILVLLRVSVKIGLLKYNFQHTFFNYCIDSMMPFISEYIQFKYTIIDTLLIY